MDLYDILLLLILAIISLFLPTLIKIIYKKVKGRFSETCIVQRYRHIEEKVSQEHLEEKEPSHLIDEYLLDSILQILQTRILLKNNMRNKDIRLLSDLGLIAEFDDIICIHEKVLERVKILENNLKKAKIILAPYHLMARRGIINIIFFEIEPSYGPRYKYATTLTEYTQRLLADRSLLTTIFVAEEDQIIDTGYSRVLIRRIPGGERGYSGIVLAEITYGSNIDEIRDILNKIDRIPTSEDEASRLVSDILI